MQAVNFIRDLLKRQPTTEARAGYALPKGYRLHPLQRPRPILNGVLPRNEWRISPGDDRHVIVLGHAKNGYADPSFVELSELPKFLAGLTADEEAAFGPYTIFAGLKGEPDHAGNVRRAVKG